MREPIFAIAAIPLTSRNAMNRREGFMWRGVPWLVRSRSFACNHKGLFAENPPREREAQVKRNQPWRLRQPALGGVRQESGDHHVGQETRELQSFDQTAIAQRGVVIEEIPILRVQEADVGLEHDDAP